MSETGNVRRQTVPGLLSALLILNGGLGLGDAHAAGLTQPASSLLLFKSDLAQAAEQEGQPAAAEVPVAAGEQTEEDVPFSELNEALTAARSRLTELTKAAEIAKVAGDLREELEATESENRQLKSVLSQLQTDNSDILSTKEAAERRIAELEKAAEKAAAETRRLDEELVSMRSQNSQLSTSLAEAETTASANAAELSQVRDELGGRTESLSAEAEEASAEVARLERELKAAQEQIAFGKQQQAESAAELANLRKTTEESTSDTARLARDLDNTITELAETQAELGATQEAFDEAKVALASTKQETGVLREQLAGNREETDQLRGRLESAEIDLDRFRTLNAGLEQQVELLKTAAGEATDAARQNLLAVENQIDEINAALASVKADELLPETDGPATEENGASSAAVVPTATPPSGDSWIPRPSPARATAQKQLISTTASETAQPWTAADPLPDAANETPEINLASLTTDLPANRQQDAQALLGELKAERSPNGLSMTVPGAQLFAVNSEQIEPSAFEALARVAQLVNLYDRRDVLIVGHTDAVGDAKYNQQLSERRAVLVKAFFVDNFEIEADRLQVEGRGEQTPISSNATADGRKANRRVEVVILD